jgi:SAM-dependent methyltransferase
MPDDRPRLYHEFPEWFHLLTAPAEYAEEAEFYRQAFVEASTVPPRTLLELGSGGGNNAFHLKRHFRCTLVDVAPGMVAVSSALNPECEHIEGDMRTVRLGRLFDCVFIHDAVGHLTDEEDLGRAIETAFVHCQPGGAAIFAPDHVRETFAPSTEHGGHDGRARSLRYLAWSWDPDPGDTTYLDDHVYLFREDGKPLRVEHDRLVMGLFAQADWLRLLAREGFRAHAKRYPAGMAAAAEGRTFVGTRPGA